MSLLNELKKLGSKLGFCDDPRRQTFNKIPDGDFFQIACGFHAVYHGI